MCELFLVRDFMHVRCCGDAAERSGYPVIDIYGTSNHYLDVNLSSRQWSVFRIPENLTMSYLGGKGIGLKLLYDRMDQIANADPLGEENILCFSMGALLSSGAPGSARFSGITKSPLTGIMVTSSCGGPFGEACKTAGWDGVLISGKASSPVILRIDELGVTFEDARDYWGLDTEQTREKLRLSVREGELTIGQAGEHGVLYANIRSGNRFLGRGGMGAVMGAKLLKAVVARGRSHVIVPVLPDLFARTRKRSGKYHERNFFTMRYRAYGTNANVRLGKGTGIYAVHNFQDRTHDEIDKLSGEEMDTRYQTRHRGCRYCSVLCGHVGSYPDGKVRHIPEYETVGMFGSNIGNFDTDRIGEWNDQMNRYGMDTMSAGGTLAWAMEASQRRLRKSSLAFGRNDNIAEVLEDIALLRGEGAELALGTRKLAETYGGEAFACQVKGLEIAAYDPRAAWGHGLGYAVSNRGGCHLNSFMAGPEALLKFLNPYTTKAKAEWAVFFEDLFSAVNSLQTCLFSVFSVILEPLIPRMTPNPILGLVMQHAPSLAQSLLDWSILSDFYRGVTGYPVTMASLKEAGARIQVLERYMNTKMGITGRDDCLPRRFTHEGETLHKRKSTVPIEPMVKRYYELRGYDESGIPTEATLRRLRILEEASHGA